MLRSTFEQSIVQILPVSEIADSTFLNIRLNSGVEDIEELASSIRRHGLLQPLVVRGAKNVAKYEIVCGHRRLSALRQLCVSSAACVLMDLSDQEALEIALTENIQRRSLDPLEEAEAFKLYITSFGRGSVTRLAAKIGKSEGYVSHRLLLLGLPKAIQDRISRRLLKCSEATELLWLKDQTKQTELANQIIGKELSSREIRGAVKLLKQQSNLTTSEAVDGVLSRRGLRIPRDSQRIQQDQSQCEDSWMLATGNNRRDDNTIALDRAILTVRTSLYGLDMIMGNTRDSGLRNVILNERTKIHFVLDELIRERIAFLKSNSRTDGLCPKLSQP